MQLTENGLRAFLDSKTEFVFIYDGSSKTYSKHSGIAMDITPYVGS